MAIRELSNEICPAGRAPCAWSGHFVAGIPCLAQMIFVGPPVGRKEDDPEVSCWFLAR
jgi:hypothetical protein